MRSHSTSNERKEVRAKALEYQMNKPKKPLNIPKDLNKFPLSFVESPLKEGPLLLFMPPGNCVLSDFIIKCDTSDIDLNLEVLSESSAHNIDFNSNDSPADITVARGDRLILSVTGDSRRVITGLIWISFYYKSI